MKHQAITILALLTVTSGCAIDKTQVNASSSSQSIVKNNIQKKQLPKKVNKQTLATGIKELKKSTVKLNGVNFKILDKEIKKGSKVLNLKMNEYGIIKGSFVIILNQHSKLDNSALKNKEKIINNTYRVWPLDSINFLTFYNKLLSDNNYSKVEVEVDYSYQSMQETF